MRQHYYNCPQIAGAVAPYVYYLDGGQPTMVMPPSPGVPLAPAVSESPSLERRRTEPDERLRELPSPFLDSPAGICDSTDGRPLCGVPSPCRRPPPPNRPPYHIVNPIMFVRCGLMQFLLVAITAALELIHSPGDQQIVAAGPSNPHARAVGTRQHGTAERRVDADSSCRAPPPDSKLTNPIDVLLAAHLRSQKVDLTHVVPDRVFRPSRLSRPDRPVAHPGRPRCVRP